MSDIVEFLKKNWIFIVIGLGTFLYFSLTESERDSSGNLTKAGWLSEDLVRVGDCIGDDVPQEETVEVYDVWATPCSQEHTMEVFYIHELQNKYQSYPGEELIDEEAYVCYGSFFNDFVGMPYEQSIYEVSYYFPLAEGWANNQTAIKCLIHDPSKETSIGSKRNTKR